MPSTIPDYEVFFDASGTLQRAGFIEKAAAAGKAIYCEKPTAVETAEALRLAKVVEDAGLKNGVVQDKLWLPGLRKFQMLKDQGFFGDILRFAANSVTGYSLANTTTNQPNAHHGTTAKKTVAA